MQMWSCIIARRLSSDKYLFEHTWHRNITKPSDWSITSTKYEYTRITNQQYNMFPLYYSETRENISIIYTKKQQ